LTDTDKNAEGSDFHRLQAVTPLCGWMALPASPSVRLRKSRHWRNGNIANLACPPSTAPPTPAGLQNPLVPEKMPLLENWNFLTVWA